MPPIIDPGTTGPSALEQWLLQQYLAQQAAQQGLLPPDPLNLPEPQTYNDLGVTPDAINGPEQPGTITPNMGGAPGISVPYPNPNTLSFPPAPTSGGGPIGSAQGGASGIDVPGGGAAFNGNGGGNAPGNDFGASEEEILRSYLYGLSHQQAQAGRRGAASSALQAYQDALLGYGSDTLAHEALGKMVPSFNQYLESPYDPSSFYSNLAAAQPLSTTGQLAREDLADTRTANEGINLANVYYGSAGKQALANLSNDQQLRHKTAESDVQGYLSGYGNEFLRALADASATETQGKQSAYADIVSRKLALGGVPGAVDPGQPAGGGAVPQVTMAPGLNLPKYGPKAPTKLAPWTPNTTVGPVAPGTIPYLSQGYGMTRPLTRPRAATRRTLPHGI